jgi:hypothetical protein
VNVEKRKIQYFRWSTPLKIGSISAGVQLWNIIHMATRMNGFDLHKFKILSFMSLGCRTWKFKILSFMNLGSRAWERQTSPSHVSNIQPHMYNTTTKSDLEKVCQYQGNKYLASTYQQSSLHILLAIHWRVHTKCPILLKLFKAQFYMWKKPWYI